jgi:CO dehydrogenase/acetyl-CoA synthase beta subunit
VTNRRNRLFCRLSGAAKDEKRFFQSVANVALRLRKHQLLVLIEKLYANTMKQVKKMAQEIYATQYGNFDTT